jgi:hypothetical protein
LTALGRLTVSSLANSTAVPTLTGLESLHVVSGRALDPDRFAGLGTVEGWGPTEPVRLAQEEFDRLSQARLRSQVDLLDAGERVVRSLAAGLTSPEVALGVIQLLPNTPDQWVNLTVNNPSGSPMQFSALNLNLQVADSGPSSEGGFGSVDGPNITLVDLVTGTLFAGNNTGTAVGGGSSQAGLWTVATDSGSVTLGAGSSALLARVRFDTTGLPTTQPWSFILGLDVPSENILTASTFVGPLGGLTTIQYSPGQIVVPEPEWTLAAVGTALAAVAVGRRLRSRPRASQATG